MFSDSTFERVINNYYFLHACTSVRLDLHEEFVVSVQSFYYSARLQNTFQYSLRAVTANCSRKIVRFVTGNTVLTFLICS